MSSFMNPYERNQIKYWTYYEGGNSLYLSMIAVLFIGYLSPFMQGYLVGAFLGLYMLLKVVINGMAEQIELMEWELDSKNE